MADLGIRQVSGPGGGDPQPVVVGGVELITVQSDQSGGQDTPTKPVEKGSQITQRNVITPENGTLNAWVESGDVDALRGLYDSREPVSVQTPEGTLSRCVVENVDRTTEGQYIDAVQVTLDWSQILVAEVGTANISAVTSDGPKTPAAGEGDGGGGGPIQSIVGGLGKDTSSGPNSSSGSGEGGGGGGGNNNNNGGGGILGGIGDTVGGWFS